MTSTTWAHCAVLYCSGIARESRADRASKGADERAEPYCLSGRRRGPLPRWRWCRAYCEPDGFARGSQHAQDSYVVSPLGADALDGLHDSRGVAFFEPLTVALEVTVTASHENDDDSRNSSRDAYAAARRAAQSGAASDTFHVRTYDHAVSTVIRVATWFRDLGCCRPLSSGVVRC